MNKVVEWLLAGPPWDRYRTLIDILGENESAPLVLQARQSVLANNQVRELLLLILNVVLNFDPWHVPHCRHR